MRFIPLLCFSFACVALAQERAAFVLKQTVPLPGVKGRFDHFAMDAKGRRLFVAALGNNTLEVIDLATDQRLQSVPGMSKPTGVLYLPDADEVLVANGGDGTLKILNGKSFKTVRNLSGFEDADNLRFDPKAKLAWLGYGDGALGILDVTAGKTIATVKLPKHPESFQLEQRGTRVFVNIPDAKQVAVVDREKRAIVATWPLEQYHANFPMALDESNRRLYVGCRNPPGLVILDADTGKLVAQVSTSGDVDDLFFDVTRKRIYLSCGEGFIDIIRQGAADSYVMKEKIRTRSGARTGFFSSALSEFYLAVPQRGNQQAELRVFTVKD
jgi:YVTN family beta-propeller protein